MNLVRKILCLCVRLLRPTCGRVSTLDRCRNLLVNVRGDNLKKNLAACLPACVPIRLLRCRMQVTSVLLVGKCLAFRNSKRLRKRVNLGYVNGMLRSLVVICKVVVVCPKLGVRCSAICRLPVRALARGWGRPSVGTSILSIEKCQRQWTIGV